MKILYVGANLHGKYAFNTYANEHGMDYEELPMEKDTPIDFPEIENQMMQSSAAVIVMDLTNTNNSEEIIGSIASKLQEAANKAIIVFCPHYTEKSKQVTSLKALGVFRFVFTADNIGIIKNEIEQCFDGTRKPLSEAERLAIIENREEIAKEHESFVNYSPAAITEIGPQRSNTEAAIYTKRIGVAGTMSRIGTTTAAIQLVKYLNTIEEGSACYIEMRKGYIAFMRKYLEVTELAQDSIRYQNVTMYESANLKEILQNGFTYLVYDYGQLDNANLFASFLERDISLLIGGAKPDELSSFADVSEKVIESPVMNYIFNFVSENDRKDVMGLMRSPRLDAINKSFFLEYAPDPFVYNPDHSPMFEKIMNSRYSAPEDAKEKKRLKSRLFRR